MHFYFGLYNDHFFLLCWIAVRLGLGVGLGLGLGLGLAQSNSSEVVKQVLQDFNSLKEREREKLLKFSNYLEPICRERRSWP